MSASACSESMRSAKCGGGILLFSFAMASCNMESREGGVDCVDVVTIVNALRPSARQSLNCCFYFLSMVIHAYKEFGQEVKLISPS